MTSADDRVQLVRDATFARVDAAGGISGTRGSSPDGLFLRDARHLSLWHLTVDGTAPVALVPATAETDDKALSVLTPRGTRDNPPAYTVFREQSVSAGMLTEHLRLVSNRPDPVTALVEITVDADFADLFELRADDRHYDKPGARHEIHRTDDGLVFDYRRADWHSRTTVVGRPAPTSLDAAPDTPSARTLSWRLRLDAHGQTDLHLTVRARPHGQAAETPTVARPHRQTASAADDLTRTCERGLADVDLLTIPVTGVDGETAAVPAAGIPWFLTLFGRDSLLTSYFLLPYRPETAAATLSALAATQGQDHDPVSGEQPGRIVHETRHGELAHFRQIPYGRYYGAVDATPLFLVLLHAHYRTTGDRALAVRLEQHARRAVDWMLTDGGLDEHGYLTYQPDPNGLVNQNWKDSAGAVCFADGTQAQGPIAVSEAQGYAYDALIRTAELAAAVWQDEPYAHRLRETAARLRTRFAADFWMPDSRLSRSGPGRPGTSGRRPGLRRRASAVVGDPGPGTRPPCRAAPAAARLLLGLGDPHTRGGAEALSPAVVPPRQRMAARQRRHRARPGPTRTRGTSTHRRRRFDRGSRSSRIPPARGTGSTTTAPPRRGQSPTPTRARLRPGPRPRLLPCERHCRCCEACPVSPEAPARDPGAG